MFQDIFIESYYFFVSNYGTFKLTEVLRIK